MTENVHVCKCCNYQTSRQSDFNKHLKTNKHQKNSELKYIGSEKAHIGLENKTKSLNEIFNFECDYCNYKTNKSSNFTRHDARCAKKMSIINNTHLENILTKKDEQISPLTESINELKEQTQKIQNTQNSGSICDHNSNNITNITQYIKNTFPNAPNVKPIENIDDVDKYLGNDYNDSYRSLIHDHYLKDIEPEDRSLWLVDSSRDKFLTRLNDNWQVDLHGEEFCKIVNKALSKALFDKNDKIKDYKEHMSFVLLELLLYVGGQSRLPTKNKSQFLLQNIKNWKNLGKKT
jgi:hypothetical protein